MEGADGRSNLAANVYSHGFLILLVLCLMMSTVVAFRILTHRQVLAHVRALSPPYLLPRSTYRASLPLLFLRPQEKQRRKVNNRCYLMASLFSVSVKTQVGRSKVELRCQAPCYSTSLPAVRLAAVVPGTARVSVDPAFGLFRRTFKHSEPCRCCTCWYSRIGGHGGFF